MGWREKLQRAMTAGGDYPMLCIATSFAEGCSSVEIDEIKAAVPLAVEHEWLLQQSNGIAIDSVVFFGGESSRFPGVVSVTKSWSDQFFLPGMVALGRGPGGESLAYDCEGRVVLFDVTAESSSDYRLLAGSIHEIFDDLLMGRRYDEKREIFGASEEWQEFLRGEGYLT